MRRPLAFSLLFALAACNRHGVADVTLDAAAAQRNATAAKTLADLQAAGDASQGPAPVVRDAKPVAESKTTVPSVSASEDNEAAAPTEDAADADSNG